MSKARIRKMNLPDAPKPTRAVRAEDPRDIEKAKRVIEHRELHLNKEQAFVVKFWDEARLCKLRRLWNEGYAVKYIARECGANLEATKNRLNYEAKMKRIKKRHTSMTQEEKEKAYKLYKAGVSASQIAKEFRRSAKSVYNAINEIEGVTK